MKQTKNTTWKQKLNSLHSLKNDINYIFSSAKKNNIPFKDILNSLKFRVYEKQKFTTLPNYMQSEIKGYIDANYQTMYDYVIWSHWYKGKFVGNKLKYDKNFNQKLVKSHYVYTGTEIIYS